MDNGPNREEELVAWGFILVMLLLVGILCALAMCSGCAHYEVDRATGRGSSYGFLRSMSVTESRTYGPDGKVTSETIVIDTKSTTGDVLMGLNEIGGTLVNAAEKVAP
jgi:hypothetical protein